MIHGYHQSHFRLLRDLPPSATKCPSSVCSFEAETPEQLRTHIQQMCLPKPEAGTPTTPDETQAPTTEPASTPAEVIDPFESPADCVVCMERKRQVVFAPCGHLVVCLSCGQGLHACPICRQVMSDRIQVFYS
mmetsp:Transcript_19780/g.42790  ORF Transcript_19780/g.42790 Transcript_19780/m.42790 type:complete len:133 (-) Transcript_19780:24-422(-)